jgi:hypothetical protein
VRLVILIISGRSAGWRRVRGIPEAGGRGRSAATGVGKVTGRDQAFARGNGETITAGPDESRRAQPKG